MEAYEQRLLQTAAPVVGDWFRAGSGASCRRLACLQEFPAQPLLQEDLLARLRAAAGLPRLVVAVRPSRCEGEAGAKLANPTCTALAWDAAALDASLLAEDDAGALGVAFKTACGAPISVFSAHLAFSDGGEGGEAARRLCGALAAARARGRAAGAAAVVVAGDFNVDARLVLDPGSADVALGPLTFQARYDDGRDIIPCDRRRCRTLSFMPTDMFLPLLRSRAAALNLRCRPHACSAHLADAPPC